VDLELPVLELPELEEPLLGASVRNRENLLKPKLFSSKPLSISSITCFRRSERMTSLRFTICSTAFSTRTQGSGPCGRRPPAFRSPVRAV
jgi:hypothetical protein